MPPYRKLFPHRTTDPIVGKSKCWGKPGETRQWVSNRPDGGLAGGARSPLPAAQRRPYPRRAGDCAPYLELQPELAGEDGAELAVQPQINAPHGADLDTEFVRDFFASAALYGIGLEDCPVLWGDLRF